MYCIMKFPSILKLSIATSAAALILCALFASCEEDDDKSVSEITIYNIPAQIKVFDDNVDKSNPTFKIYLNASNSMSEDDDPAAKGVEYISNGTLSNEKYSVTIKLHKPNPKGVDDPNATTAPWTGTAKYFSVMISPQDVGGYEHKAIWMKASTKPLDKGLKNCDWDKLKTDLSAAAKSEPNSALGKKVRALYEGITIKDNDIKKEN